MWTNRDTRVRCVWRSDASRIRHNVAIQLCLRQLPPRAAADKISRSANRMFAAVRADRIAAFVFPSFDTRLLSTFFGTLPTLLPIHISYAEIPVAAVSIWKRQPGCWLSSGGTHHTELIDVFETKRRWNVSKITSFGSSVSHGPSKQWPGELMRLVTKVRGN